jgi:hypothetical protein
MGGYEVHSLSMLRRVAKALNARVRVVLEPAAAELASRLAKSSTHHGVRRRLAKSPCPAALAAPHRGFAHILRSQS